MKKITEILKEKEFTVSVELVPPRNGINPEEIFSKIDFLKDKVDFVSVTKGAGGSLRGGTLPITYFAQEEYSINAIAHFVCRERTVNEIENDLVDLHYFGIRNILALRGDPPAGSNEGIGGDYEHAYLLARQIKNMNNGNYLLRKGQDKGIRQGIKTDFCILAAGHPEDPIKEEISHIKAKIDAGAEAIITQMIFSFDEYKNYVDALRKAGINVPVIPGIRPITDLKQAESVESFFRLQVSDELKQALGKKGKDFSISYFADMIKKLKEYGAPGVHLFVLNDVELVGELLERI